MKIHFVSQLIWTTCTFILGLLLLVLPQQNQLTIFIFLSLYTLSLLFPLFTAHSHRSLITAQGLLFISLAFWVLNNRLWYLTLPSIFSYAYSVFYIFASIAFFTSIILQALHVGYQFRLFHPLLPLFLGPLLVVGERFLLHSANPSLSVLSDPLSFGIMVLDALLVSTAIMLLLAHTPLRTPSFLLLTGALGWFLLSNFLALYAAFQGNFQGGGPSDFVFMLGILSLVWSSSLTPQSPS